MTVRPSLLLLLRRRFPGTVKELWSLHTLNCVCVSEDNYRGNPVYEQDVKSVGIFLPALHTQRAPDDHRRIPHPRCPSKTNKGRRRLLTPRVNPAPTSSTNGSGDASETAGRRTLSPPVSQGGVFRASRRRLSLFGATFCALKLQPHRQR